jgi:hypothetical protein
MTTTDSTYTAEMTELYWDAAGQEPRRIRIFQNNALAEELGFGAAGTWGFAWYDVDGDGYASEAEARAAAMVAGRQQWPALESHPMED